MVNQDQVRRIVRVGPVNIPTDSPFSRTPPRKVEQRQADYMEKFDAKTLFYDVFRSEDRVMLSGPPLLNLKKSFETAHWSADGRPVTEAHLQDLDRTQHSWLTVQDAASKLTVDLGDLKLTASVGENYSHLFADRKVIFTKSKNNQLDWIRDWGKFHAIEHGVDALLLYDNGSDTYGLNQLLDKLGEVKELAVIVVVEWPFRFGPQGGSWDGLKKAPWDSDFCEYGILEHARHRFLKRAEAVLHQDIDELVIAKDSRSVFDHLNDSDAGAISYRGRWIETADAPDQTVPQFQDFLYFDVRKAPTTSKWAASPRKIEDAIQWKTHQIRGIDMHATEDVVHRHFLGMNSNWKRQRTRSIPIDSKFHAYDEQLGETLVRTLGAGRQPLEVLRGEAFERVRLMTRLQEVQSIIDGAEELPSGVVREWYYTPSVLVFDYSLRGRRFAFDLSVSDIGWTLTVEGRSDAAWYTIRRQTFGRGHLLDKKSKLELRKWDRATSNASIAAETLAEIQWVAELMSNADAERPHDAIDSYWWDHRTNFGDLIGPWIIERITGRPVHNTIGDPTADGALATVGSIINQLQRPGITIWGSGLIAPLQERDIARLREREPANILAVRGWKTYSELTTKLGWKVPKVFGDPALLLPYFFKPPAGLPSAGKTVVCPHYQHNNLFGDAKDYDCHVIDVARDAPTVVAELATAKSVISTSLHGIIVAQAYGVPWLWLRVDDKQLPGGEFKFEDFFSTLDVKSVAQLSVSKTEIRNLNLEELGERARLPKSIFNHDDLLASFPYPGASKALGTRGRARQMLKRNQRLRQLSIRSRKLIMMAKDKFRP